MFLMSIVKKVQILPLKTLVKLTRERIVKNIRRFYCLLVPLKCTWNIMMFVLLTKVLKSSNFSSSGREKILSWSMLKTGNLAVHLRLPEASNIFDDFPNGAVPLRNFRHRIFTLHASLQSTKRPREEEDTLTSSKRTKLDSTSQKSVCHVCHFKLKKKM